MMKTCFLSAIALVACLVGPMTAVRAQQMVIAGSFQGWAPETGTVMNDMGGGIFEATISGLNPGDFHEFKILQTDELPAAWGNPEWTPTNNWFRADASGGITIRLNTTVGVVGENHPNVGTSSTNWTPQLVGDFMDEAGGAGDWVNPDASFDMTYVSGTEWTRTITISTPGNYLMKLVTNGEWNRQFNVRGYADLFAEDFSFTTTTVGEQVKVTFDSLTPSLTLESLVGGEPSIVNSRVFHAGYAGSGTPPWNAIDDQKLLIQRGPSSQLVGLENITNSSRGINGVVLDVDGLESIEDLNFEYKMSPMGAFDQNANPPASWVDAPTPESTALFPGAGAGGSDRVLIEWADNAIANRYLLVRVLFDSNVIGEYFVGHLLGETTGIAPPGTPFTVAFADITPIRSAVGSAATAGSSADIDKSGTVSFADISAMRSNVGVQLTQITVPSF